MALEHTFQKKQLSSVALLWLAANILMFSILLSGSGASLTSADIPVNIGTIVTQNTVIQSMVT